MIHSTRVGSMEIIKPDKETQRIVRKIIAQNSKILDMNAELLKVIAIAPIVVAPLEADDE